jgi:hypothetical protein
MSVLTPPRHPLVDAALAQARTWCAGRVIDNAPALAHAVKVTTTLSRHVPDLDPQLAAAALLHDAPEFAPAGLDLDHALTTRFGPTVTRVVRALEAEHRALDQHDPPPADTDRDVLLVATADKIIALTSLLRRAYASGDPEGFWISRPALLRLRGYFHDTHQHTVGRVPSGMSDHLGRVLKRLDRATHHLAAQTVAQPGDSTWTCDDLAASSPNSGPDQKPNDGDACPNKHWPAATGSSSTVAR